MSGFTARIAMQKRWWDFLVRAAVFVHLVARVERFRRLTASSVRFGLRPRRVSGF